MRKSFHYERNWPAGRVPTIIGSVGEIFDARSLEYGVASDVYGRAGYGKRRARRVDIDTTGRQPTPPLYLHGGGYRDRSLDSREQVFGRE